MSAKVLSCTDSVGGRQGGTSDSHAETSKSAPGAWGVRHVADALGEDELVELRVDAHVLGAHALRREGLDLTHRARRALLQRHLEGYLLLCLR